MLKMSMQAMRAAREAIQARVTALSAEGAEPGQFPVEVYQAALDSVVDGFNKKLGTAKVTHYPKDGSLYQGICGSAGPQVILASDFDGDVGTNTNCQRCLAILNNGASAPAEEPSVEAAPEEEQPQDVPQEGDVAADAGGEVAEEAPVEEAPAE